MTEKKVALLYGMQRTGSNYTQQLLKQNFINVGQHNDAYSRCLPTHKHFRLYDEKWIIPEAKYFNHFTYANFNEFKNHTEQILGREINLFVVTIKNPYSWYISYQKHAKRNRYIYYRKYVNSHCIIDYNLYYKKWYEFSLEAPDQVLIVRYEDLINEFEATLDKIKETFNLVKAEKQYRNPEKVPMSSRFSDARRKYYESKKYLEEISRQDYLVIRNMLDKTLVSALGYDNT